MLLEELRSIFSFPSIKPSILPNEQGWFCNQNEILEIFSKKKYSTLLEIGTWLDQSTLFFLRNFPDLQVICLDHWLGSIEHLEDKQWRDYIPTLYDTFLANVWDFKSRIIPLRADCYTGLKLLEKFNITPDIIYLDGSHDYESVYYDLTNITKLFPSSKLIGDDWRYQSIQQALKDCYSIAPYNIAKPVGKNNFWEIINET